MIDVVRFKQQPPPHLGFQNVYHLSEFRCFETYTPEKLRQLCSTSAIDIIFSTETSPQPDKHDKVRTPLSPLICKLAAQKRVAIGFGFSNLLAAPKEKQPSMLARMIHHVRLCRKYKVKMVLASLASSEWQMRSAHDLLAFGITLGMHPKEAKDALNFRKKEPIVKVSLP